MSVDAPARPTSAPPPRLRQGRAFRAGPVSGRLHWRQVVVPVAGFAVLVLAAALSMGRGDFPIGVGDVLRTLVGLGEGPQPFIILELRAPRVVVGALVGLALGVAGALFQTFARNPLASPDTLGITMGASVGAVAAIVLSGSSSTGAILGGLGVPLAALLGALVTGVLLFALTWRAGVDGYRLVLIGIALWSAGTALTDWLLTNAEIYDAASAYVWITGSLNARTWENALPLGVAVAVLLPLTLAAGRVLAVLQFGDDTARGLGVRVAGAQAAVVLLAVFLVAFAVSAAGPITFVALVVPQIAVRLTGGSRPPLLASGILGALLVVTADLITRTALPQALPVGILTAVFGAPYLLWLLVRGRRRATL
ncbi:iron chelate uptake ABC transporter family permease subunit [Blastococcus sp. BMG 814]|uniref:Iron chelate uptake ABC transporter family permease subunit n=1 Tax=Blastococcus carthaginiensis TaxID=3050034 RepID=A0ABT9I6C8_9ACTN|nr:iron chelate uptake ABC transporter family permease subunit [Blastococcus carthaginiensis]MDP5181130.1 iron chelate uptake ABC transporter family permease subunit [Blastococcus carthaginiensis]